MMTALLRSEWIKFRSYYLAVGGALAFVCLIPFLMTSLDYTQTADLEVKALSEFLHALYLAQPAVVVLVSLYFGQDFIKSGLRTNFLAVSKRRFWLLGRISFLFLLLLSLYFLIFLGCLAVLVWHFRILLSWELLGRFILYGLPALLSNLALAYLAAGLALLFESWILPVSLLFPLLVGLSRFLATFFKEAKYLPDLATLNLFEYQSLQQSFDLKGLGIQLLWLILVWGAASVAIVKRDIR